jgi:hypothetical protein
MYRSKRGLLRRSQFRAKVISTDNGLTLWVTGESYNNRAELKDRCIRDFPHAILVDNTQIK